MANSKRLAGLVGPAMVAVTASELLNYRIFATIDPRATYLNGCLLFIAGVATVRDHNVWRGWPVLLTITGWVLLLGGVYRMFIPGGAQGPDTPIVRASIGALTLLGVFLTYKGYVTKGD